MTLESSHSAMIEPTGLGEEPHVRVTVTKTALWPLSRQSFKARNTITSTFSMSSLIFYSAFMQRSAFIAKN